MLRQKNDRNTLNLQQPLVSNSQYNIIPPKSVPNQDNLINNKLIFNTNKKLIIDPQNKAKLLKSRPVDYIYKDKTKKIQFKLKKNFYLLSIIKSKIFTNKTNKKKAIP